MKGGRGKNGARLRKEIQNTVEVSSGMVMTEIGHEKSRGLPREKKRMGKVLDPLQWIDMPISEKVWI